MVTALFADIVDSTRLTQRMPPEAAGDLVRRAVSAMCTVVEEHGGVVGSVMGDGIAAFFGLEVVSETDPDRAALAGLEIVEAIRSLQSDSETFLQVRVGINSGLVTVGPLDGTGQILAWGDAVNIAARLQEMAEPGEVLAGNGTMTRTARPVGKYYQGSKTVVDFGSAIPVWHLSGNPQIFDRISFPRCLVGRAHEEEVFARCFSDLLLGRGQAILLTGGGGLGKTALLDRFKKIVGERAIWFSLSFAGKDPEPWSEIESMLEVLAKDKDLERCFHEDKSLLHDHSGESPDYPNGSKKGMRLIRELSSLRPIVLTIDDIHGSVASLGPFVRDLVPLLLDCRILLILSGRDLEGVTSFAAWDGNSRDRICRMELQALCLADSVDLAWRISDEDNSAKAAIIARLSGGSPLFISELTRWNQTEEGNDGGIPPRLQQILLPLYFSLSSETRALVRLVALTGPTFTHEVLSRIAGPNVEALRTELLRSGFVLPAGLNSGPGYRFRHVLLVEAVRSTIPKQHLTDLYRLVAELLVSGRPTCPEVSEMAGRSFLQSGMWNDGIHWLEVAAREAETNGDVNCAVRCWTTILSFAQCQDQAVIARSAETSLARMAARFGDLDGCSRILQDILEREGPVMSCDIAVLEAWALFEQGYYSLAEKFVEMMLGSVYEGSTRFKAHAALRGNRYDELREILATSSIASSGPIRHELELEFDSIRLAFCIETGNLEASAYLAERRTQVYQTSDDLIQCINARGDVAIWNLVIGDLGKSVQLLRENLVTARSIGYARGIVESASNLLYVLGLIGLPVGADVPLDDLPFTSLVWKAALLTNQGFLAFEGARWGRARSLFEEAVRIGSRLEGEKQAALEPRIRLAAVDVVEGRFEEAIEALRAALDEAVAMGGRYELRALARRWIAEAHLRRGEPERALDEATTGLVDAERAERPSRVPLWRVIGLAREAIRPGSGRVALHHARRLARRMGMALEEVRALDALARITPPRWRWAYTTPAEDVLVRVCAPNSLVQAREVVAV